MTPDTILVRAPDIELTLDARGDVRVRTSTGPCIFAPVALALLDAFARPRSVGDVLAQIGDRGREQFIEASSALVEMHRAGVLNTPDAKPEARARGYVAPAIHIAMLNDRPRTSAFTRALHAVVQKGDVVVDIGTGTGILATTAARAGAKRVFAVEATSIADVAREIFEKNGVAERVELALGRSYSVTLSEPCDVLVSEMIGNDPLDEDLLEIFRDAHARLLKPGARVIPSAIDIYAIAVDIPDEYFARIAFTPDAIARWTHAAAIDFSPLAAHRLGPGAPATVRPREAAFFPPCAVPQLLAHIDLTRAPETIVEAEEDLVITRDASHLGVMLAFTATLAPGITLSTLPADHDATNHWWYALWPAWPRLNVRAGDSVRARWTRRTGVTEMRFA